MDFPALWTITFFALEWTRPLASESVLTQEWTSWHGQRAGLRPSWLAWLAYGQRRSPGGQADVGAGQTSGQRADKVT